MAVIDLEQETIASLGAKMAAGEITARLLTQHCLDRIAALDEKLSAIIELNPDALDIADAMDGERAKGTLRGPLHGMPILIKDNLDTGDRMMTTAGSVALVGAPAPDDAFVVKKLRDAGAVILGKTNLSEWANYRSTRSSSGWSSRGGQTRNAYDQLRSPGGSSSGSAVAVAAGFCVAAVGTETEGSIVSPSSMNSIVGFKPTVGMVGRTGIIPISHTQDTAGPMARSVADAAVLLAAICGTDPDDPITGDAAAHCNSLKTLTLDPDALNGARIGVARNYGGFHEGVDALLAQAIEDLGACGAIVLDDLHLTPVEDMRPCGAVVMSTEFKVGLNAYLSKRADTAKIKSLADLVSFNRDHADEVMPWFQQELTEKAQATDGINGETYLEAIETCRELSRSQGIDHLIKTYQLDAIIAPTTCTPWLIDWVNGDNRTGGSAGPAAIAGYPNVTVPMGYVHDLPVGLSFFSTAWRDAELLNLAGGYERKTRRRVAPAL
jgi:amidase